MANTKEFNSNLFIIIIVILVNSLSYGIIIPLLYPYVSKFGLSATGFGLLFASFSLAQMIATPIIGRLSDKYGRKPLLLGSLFGTAISLALFASAQNITMLFVARILDGITGGNISVAQAMISDVTKPQDRAKAFGMLGAVFGVSFIVGPAVGGLLSGFDLTSPFWFAASLALLGTILGIFLLKETSNKQQVNSSQTLSLNMYKKAFMSPLVGPFLILGMSIYIAQNAMIVGFQSFSVDSLKLNPSQVGLIFTMFGILNVVVQGFGIKWLMSKFPNKRFLLQTLLVLSCLGMVIVSLSQSYYFFVGAMLAYGLASSPILSILTSLISQNTKAEDQGGILGINQSLVSLGQVIGPLVASLAVGIQPRYAFYTTAGLYLVSIFIAKIQKPSHTKLDI